MASIAKFTKKDPQARVNLTLPESVRLNLEEFKLFYAKNYGDTPKTGPLIEELLKAWLAQDTDFQAFRAGMSGAQKALAKKALEADADKDDKAAPGRA